MSHDKLTFIGVWSNFIQKGSSKGSQIVQYIVFMFAFSSIWLLGLATKFQWLWLDRVKRNWYLSPMRAAKVQASLRIRVVSPEPSLLAHTSSESRGTFRQIARSLVPMNSWACAVKICYDGMLEDTNSLDGALALLALPMSVFFAVCNVILNGAVAIRLFSWLNGLQWFLLTFGFM